MCNSSKNYGAISRSLHWLMALLVFIMLALGWGRDYAPGSWRAGMLGLHKSIGILILALACARLVWRLYNHPPAYAAPLSKRAQYISSAAHWLLYLLLFSMPLSGWLMVSAMGRPPVILGAALPPLLAQNRAIVPVLKEIHGAMAYGLAGLILLHIGAAIFHHFVCKDDVLRRMLPPRKERTDKG